MLRQLLRMRKSGVLVSLMLGQFFFKIKHGNCSLAQKIVTQDITFLNWDLNLGAQIMLYMTLFVSSFSHSKFEFGFTHQYVSAKDVKGISSPLHLSVQETYIWDGKYDFESKKMQWKLLFPQWVPWLWSSYMTDRFCQIFLALDVDEFKDSTKVLAPWDSQETHTYNLMLPPQVRAVRTWKQERDTLSPTQMSQLPWKDVQAWPVPSAQLASLLTHLLSFSLFLFCPLSDICYYIIAQQWEWHKMPFPVSSLVVKTLFLQQKLLICSSLMLGEG